MLAALRPLRIEALLGHGPEGMTTARQMDAEAVRRCRLASARGPLASPPLGVREVQRGVPPDRLHAARADVRRAPTIRLAAFEECLPMITIVVFDMDGVLCRYRMARRLARLASWSGHSCAAIHAAIWRSGFEDEAERGILSAEDYLRGCGERLGYPLSAAQWVEARRVAIEPDPAVLALVRQLSVARLVGMFTNNPWLLKQHIAEVFPAVPELFGTSAVFSAELGRSKPDPEAFRRLATRLACAPDEILYFDDYTTYVAGAREAGLLAHHVGGAPGVRAGLAMYGLDRG
jgi:putative hydrolase of the HAD superfamily